MINLHPNSQKRI